MRSSPKGYCTSHIMFFDRAVRIPKSTCCKVYSAKTRNVALDSGTNAQHKTCNIVTGTLL